MQGYQRPELWDVEAYSHLQTSGQAMPATWSLLDGTLVPPGASSSAAPQITNTRTAPPGKGLGAASNGGSGGSATTASNSCCEDTLSEGLSSNGNNCKPGAQLWVHMPEASYRWEEVADCPVYVRYARRHDAIPRKLPGLHSVQAARLHTCLHWRVPACRPGPSTIPAACLPTLPPSCLCCAVLCCACCTGLLCFT